MRWVKVENFFSPIKKYGRSNEIFKLLLKLIKLEHMSIKRLFILKPILKSFWTVKKLCFVIHNLCNYWKLKSMLLDASN